MKEIVVNYEAGARELAQQLFGRQLADDELARLAGALSGATVKVTGRQQKGYPLIKGECDWNRRTAENAIGTGVQPQKDASHER